MTICPKAPLSRQVSRRAILGGAASALVLSGLAAPRTRAQPADDAVRGGSFRLGITGYGSAESLDPHLLHSMASISYCSAVFETLTIDERTGGVGYLLAESVEPADATATEWIVTLRPGITWHDGSSLKAQDVLWSFSRIKDPNVGSLAASRVADIDMSATRATSDRQINVVLKRPNALFPRNLTTVMIVQDKVADFLAPVGTGPFKVQSFEPGREGVFVRNERYWRSGLPYLDELRIVSFADATARFNAFQAGQLDALTDLSLSAARAIAGDADKSVSGIMGDGRLRVVNGAASQYTPVYMDMSLAPFRDVRVRQAMKHAFDRDLAIKQVLQGFGVKANDNYGLGFEGYADLPQREYDPDRAKSLLKQAGLDGLKVELMTAPIGLGAVEAPLVFRQSAKSASIDIAIRQVPAEGFYAKPRGPLFIGNWSNLPFHIFYFRNYAQTAPFNSSKFDRPELDAVMLKAMATLDDKRRDELFAQVQREIWETGGDIVWSAGNWVDGISERVGGVTPGGKYPMGNFEYATWWITP